MSTGARCFSCCMMKRLAVKRPACSAPFLREAHEAVPWHGECSATGVGAAPADRMRTNDAISSAPSPLLGLRRAKTWLALVAVVSACAVPVAQARAASCERAAALVSAASIDEHGAVDAHGTVDAHSDAEAPVTDLAETPCPSVVAIAATPSSMTPAPSGGLAARVRFDRAPPPTQPSGLERPPRRA